MPDWVREYQTLIGAVIAFVGVSWTLYWNARAGRKLERFKSEQQRIALLAAFRAELTVIQSMLSRPLQDFLISVSNETPPGSEAKSIVYPRLPATVYENNVDKIGLLGVSLSATVVIAYSEIAQFEEAVIALQSAGEDIDQDEATFSAAWTFNEVGHAIDRIKESLPEKEQNKLIMFSQPKVRRKDIEWFLERKKEKQSHQAGQRTTDTPTDS
jgi:hypothetical protein